MTAPMKIFLALEDGIDGDAIQAALPVGVPVRTLPLREAGERTFRDLQATADLVVVACSSSPDQAMRAIEGAVHERPDRPVVVLYAGSPNGFMERAFEAGAEDLITLPQTQGQLRFALEKALARRRGATSASAAPMITVLGPKGGTGKTLTSANLAVALAIAGKSPVVVDLDLQFGDVGLALGLRPERTIYDLSISAGSLDGDKLDGFLATHPSGARALLAPLRPDQAASVTPQFLRDVYALLRERYDTVIVDTPPAFTAEVIATIDLSSHLCMVGMLDALSLKNTKIGFETLAQMGYQPQEITLVLNRADSNVGITESDVERLLGRKPDVMIPSDRAIPRALTGGQPIVVAEPKSGAARAFVQLAQQYASERGTPDAASTSDLEGARGRRRLLRRGGS